jgi:hypothetical protein
MTTAPYISFVAGSRNDDHGGNLGHRMQVLIENLLAQCDRHGLDAELVLVEWNPPEDRPSLAEALVWPKSSLCCVRILTVPADLHSRFDHARALPLHQMIAKNVGILRARGAFVAVTNIDVLLSDDLIRFLAEKKLDADVWYRADRLDVAANVPAGASAADQLAYCRDHPLRRHRRDGTHDLTTGRFNRIFQDPGLLHAFCLLAPLSFLPGLETRLDNAKRSLAFIEACGRLHTNACGDFTAMARERWHHLRGYWEFAGFPSHIDGLTCYAAAFSEMTERILPDSHCVYHIEHGSGSGFAGYTSGEKWKDLEKDGIPRLTPNDYRKTVFDMKAGRLPLIRNDENWGLGEYDLAETTPCTDASATRERV